ncbi:YqzL family protein [Alkalithermobacter paradoxus]|uniref:YqzL-like protein n=1 Tax=Alkalithermobacter paradoxus TaxID=29349 RepID=A0A1V4IAG2_9FIRM|nr:hypothetical protein CLOTH_02800 [[Clostridium] thermoalcaliphilum]
MQNFFWNYFKQTGDIEAYLYLLKLNSSNEEDSEHEENTREINDAYINKY